MFIYSLSEEGKLKEQFSFPTGKGAGPRHLDFNPAQPDQFAVINENSSTLNYYRKEGDFDIRRLDSLSTLPAGFKENNTCADVHFHPSGKFLYGSNRGHNSIVVYTIGADGKLTRVDNTPTQGEIPRGFTIDPSGKWLLAGNQNSDNVVVFSIDQRTGKLSPTGQQLKVEATVCVRFASL